MGNSLESADRIAYLGGQVLVERLVPPLASRSRSASADCADMPMWTRSDATSVARHWRDRCKGQVIRLHVSAGSLDAGMFLPGAQGAQATGVSTCISHFYVKVLEGRAQAQKKHTAGRRKHLHFAASCAGSLGEGPGTISKEAHSTQLRFQAGCLTCHHGNLLLGCGYLHASFSAEEASLTPHIKPHALHQKRASLTPAIKRCIF